MVFRKDIEELVCLQLIGLSPKQILEMNKNSVYDIISHAENTYKKATQIIKEQVEAGVEMISYYDENYPKHFKENLGNDAPPLLHLLGNVDLLSREDCVTIIGARKADKEGCEAAYRLAYNCTKKGHPIVSGLALVSGTMYAVHFAREYEGDIYGWENDVYAVAYDSYDEKSSGNRYLLEQGLAIPIKLK